jgi:hypothetical protein
MQTGLSLSHTVCDGARQLVPYSASATFATSQLFSAARSRSCGADAVARSSPATRFLDGAIRAAAVVASGTPLFVLFARPAEFLLAFFQSSGSLLGMKQRFLCPESLTPRLLCWQQKNLTMRCS